MLFIRTSRGCEYLGLALPTRYRQRRRRACSARARPLAALFAVFCGRLLAGLLEITAAQRSKPRACQAFQLWSGPAACSSPEIWGGTPYGARGGPSEVRKNP